MKKATLILCLLAAMVLLTGCGAQKQGEEPAAKKLPLAEKVKSAVPDTEELAELAEEDLTDVLGIEPEDFTEFVFLQSDGTDGREILAIRAKDKDAADKIAALAESYLERRRNETRNYIPELYQLLTETKVLTSNQTVVLVVGQNAESESNKILSGE